VSPTRRFLVQPPRPPIDQGLSDIQAELKLPTAFPAEVEAAAAIAAANPRLPDLDRTDIPFVTIDPPESMDLDQALHVERRDDGYRVYYAIADVGAFVTAGDPIDVEANVRGETLYGANAKIPLHPKALSEAAASLLPGQVRPALLWTIDLDAQGERTQVDVRRARVMSRTKLDYAGVQRDIDAGVADPMWAVLRDIGTLRKACELARGGVSLPLPEQDIRKDGDHWTVEFRARLAIEDWNEQISLLTGMSAAHLMIGAKVGLLRTLPPPDPSSIRRLHRTAAALGIVWTEGMDYAHFIRSLDPARPAHIAMLTACTSVLRGAGYVAFDGTLPAYTQQSALATEYAHATAPLRRLVDRYVGEVCVAVCAKQPVPGWVRVALPGLPLTMQAADRRAGQYERSVVDLVEAMVMSSRVGEVFDGTVVEVTRDDARRGVIVLREPAIEATVVGSADLPLGATIKVKLIEADPVKRIVRFEPR
jgi:exoribonuclease R